MPTTLYFSCLHAPYHHLGAFDFLHETQKDWRPDRIVCLGDEADLYAASRYAHDPEMPRLPQEIKKLRAAMGTLALIFPDMAVCESNHPRRLYARAAESGLSEDVLRSWPEIIGAPKTWVWKRWWKLAGTVATHGEELAGVHAAKNAVDAFGSNVVCGHLHGQAGVRIFQGFGKRRWCLQVGCLIRVGHPAFDYSKMSRTQPVLGCGVVADGVPHFIPMGV